MGFSVVGSGVQTGAGAGARFRLDFHAMRNVEYEVHFRESLDKASSPVPFSTTPDGAADQMVFPSTSTTDVSLYVQRQSAAGFYRVAVRVTNLDV